MNKTAKKPPIIPAATPNMIDAIEMYCRQNGLKAERIGPGELRADAAKLTHTVKLVLTGAHPDSLTITASPDKAIPAGQRLEVEIRLRHEHPLNIDSVSLREDRWLVYRRDINISLGRSPQRRDRSHLRDRYVAARSVARVVDGTGLCLTTSLSHGLLWRKQRSCR